MFFLKIAPTRGSNSCGTARHGHKTRFAGPCRGGVPCATIGRENNIAARECPLLAPSSRLSGDKICVPLRSSFKGEAHNTGFVLSPADRKHKFRQTRSRRTRARDPAHSNKTQSSRAHAESAPFSTHPSDRKWTSSVSDDYIIFFECQLIVVETRSPLYHPRIKSSCERYKAGIPRDLRVLDKLEPGLTAPV